MIKMERFSIVGGAFVEIIMIIYYYYLPIAMPLWSKIVIEIAGYLLAGSIIGQILNNKEGEMNGKT